MAKGSSISIEETNKIRAKFGLKLIPIGKEEERRNTTYWPKTFAPINESKDNDATQLLKSNRVTELREHLKNLKKAQSDETDDYNDDEWFEKLYTRDEKKKKRLPVVGNSKDDEEDLLPSVQVSHDIKDLVKDKPAILTLKDTSLIQEGENSDDETILENQDIVYKEEQAKKLKLQKLNKLNKRKVKLNIASEDIEKDESNTDSSTVGTSLLIGAETNIYESRTVNKREFENDPTMTKINLENNNNNEDSDSDTNDFKRPKIKKRKKLSSTITSKIRENTTINLDNRVNLIDEDIDLEENGTFINNIILKSKNNGKLLNQNKKSIEEVEQDIFREKMEREQRKKNIALLHKAKKKPSFVIDENTTFLESLEPKIVETSTESFEKVNLYEDAIEKNASTASIPDDVATTKDIREEQGTKQHKSNPDFYNGIASTFKFLHRRSDDPLENE